MNYLMITIRTLTPQDEALFPEGLELLNRTQGRDLFKPNYLAIRTQDPNSLVIGAFQGRNLVGLGIAQILPADGFSFYLPFDHTLPETFSKNQVGSFSTLCVREDLQGQGVGQKISIPRLEWLQKKNCNVILGVSWVSGLKHTSHRVFEKLGFKPVKAVEKFFEKMSLENPFQCPGCRKQPCACNAILYRLDF